MNTRSATIATVTDTVLFIPSDYCLSGDHTILTVGSAPINFPLQETSQLLSNGEPPPIEDTNTPTIEDESVNRGAQLMSYVSLEDTEKIG
jgi:hypothetical protein